jgi:hypothetical protein
MFKRVGKPSSSSGHTEDAIANRTGPMQERLNEEGAAMLEALNGKVSLAHTAKHFPRVINNLAPYVHKPRLMLKAVDELLMPGDLRQRQGFPFEAAEELGNLKLLYLRFLDR